VKALLRYLALSATLVGLLAIVLAHWVVPAAGTAIWVAAGLAFLVQAVAFTVLVLSRGSGTGILIAWGGGTLLRLVAVLGVALWVARSEYLPVAPLLLSMAGFLFLLLMLEPVFIRTGVRSR
jgi:hypothetical protein